MGETDACPGTRAVLVGTYQVPEGPDLGLTDRWGAWWLSTSQRKYHWRTLEGSKLAK